MSGLVRPEHGREDDVEALGARVLALEDALAARVAEIAQVQADLRAFTRHYRLRVGLLHEQLDDLEYAIAEAELGVLAGHLAGREEPPAAPPAGEAAEAAPRFTSDGVRQLFREVAKAVHPDLASDPDARDRRHALMVEANRAYALGDEARLRLILRTWEHSDALAGDDAEAVRVRLTRRIALFDAELAVCDSELAALKDTPIWQLKTLVDEAAARGTDLIADLVRRLERDILVARNRLDAMQSTR